MANLTRERIEEIRKDASNDTINYFMWIQQREAESFPSCKHCTHPGEFHDEEFGICQSSSGPNNEPCECSGYEPLQNH